VQFAQDQKIVKCAARCYNLLVNKKEKRKQKMPIVNSVKEMKDAIISKWGFENINTICFFKACEEYRNDRHALKPIYEFYYLG
jgi:hypothetical protein